MVASRAMQRREQVAERAGSLVTERVRELIGSAQARADRVRREAGDEVRDLDARRVEAASRIVSQVETLERELRRLRQTMGSEGDVEGGSVVDEDRLIEAAADDEAAVAAPAAEEEVQPSEDEVQPSEEEVQPSEEEIQPPEDDEIDRPEETESPADPPGQAESDQRTRAYSVQRPAGDDQAPEALAEEEGSSAPEPGETRQASATQTRACTVCGREVTGTEGDLDALGWKVSASGEATCADCHSAGWLETGN